MTDQFSVSIIQGLITILFSTNQHKAIIIDQYAGNSKSPP